ncbi:hypothetical protein GIB67_008314 [Kingdonia uniflora]|uniref:ferric-chelate reductase (NADH) n=1 Tax=Kingdonia uniflora TaxID=39325 RepID=A0A7J7N4W8_9MAGN|nr:hypothetical protein GIB67_008314 [Kingdonia uniflora]
MESATSSISLPTKYQVAKMRNIRAALMTVLVVVFIGWIIFWIMLPTKTYKHIWLPRISAKANSTYFGEQGTNLYLFTFPMIFIAAFSCIYLHYVSKEHKSDDSLSTGETLKSLAFLRRPVFVKAPLGIVTATELMFSATFIALLIWSLANYLYVSFGHLMMHKEGEPVWEAKFRSVSLRLGYIGNTCWAFLFFPVTRGSSILPLVGLTSESSIKYHIWLGHLSMVLFSAHSIGFIIYWAMTNQMVEMLDWSRTYVSNMAGEIAFVLALAIWATSLPRIRRKMFELFFYAHHLYILYIFFYVLHVGVSFFCTILPGIFLFLIDRYLRFLQSRERVRVVSVRILPCEALELNFSKSPGLTYTPTSIVFINVPIISKIQWHPFTVISNCKMETDKLSIAIKCDGNWSQMLYQTLSRPSPLDHLDVSVEGPYGPTSSQFLRHESLVMITGGSGITAMISIIREMIQKNTINNCSTPQILLICAFKTSADLAMLELLVPVSGTACDIFSTQLKIEAYVTRETEQPDKDTKNLIRTIWFSPNSSDKPITAILGPNSWIWLCAIISSSFLMFLLFLGIITRYHIYPIEHDTNVIYHFTGRALWDMFIICVCVVTVASLVFLWNKKQHAIEGNQIQHMDAQSPTTTPGSLVYHPDQELESFPQQSLVQATNVHFGAKPDLKNILLNCKGSNVGVLVCGPRKMRHEVAKICSSGSADNLHFEAISFNW